MFFTQTSYNLEKFKPKLGSKNYQLAKDKILQDIKLKSHGFIQDLFDDNLEEIEKIKKDLEKFEQLLFLGTGGSSLGGKTLVSIKNNFFVRDRFPKIHFLENVDEHSIYNLVKKINLKKTGIVVISKSGETIETISQFFFIKHFMENIKDYKKRFFIITEKKKSSLKNLQETYNFNFYEHKKNIGGRFSIFSLVGLLPGSLAGIDTFKFRKGGIKFLEFLTKNNNAMFDELFFTSFSIILSSKKNCNMSVFMPYIDRLKNFSLWYRQLWAESIGKNGFGLTPVNALGTVDQHSQLQLYLDGPKDKFFTIIGKKNKSKSLELDCRFAKSKKFHPLHGKTLEQLLMAEMKATIETIKNKKLPLRYIEVNEIAEMELGALVMFFFIETIFCCYLINVNPFNQPAVEEGKILTKKFLENEKN
mgnify:CR=1 FL=1|jgi:glucose-6-phosphate isomerase